jgi:ferredoxin
MTAEIYYFTGTGNSLVVARDIANKINGRLISIASMMDQEKIACQAEVIGIVCPVYFEPLGGLPLIVHRFMDKLENLNDKYVFAICTYGSGGTMALNTLDRLLQAHGSRLSAGFRINMPENMAPSTINTPQRQKKMFALWNKNSSKIAERIKARKQGGFDTPNALVGAAYILVKLLAPPLMPYFKKVTLRHMQKYNDLSVLSYDQLMNSMDRSFALTERCIGCGNCARICPVANIELVDGKPTWLHHCELCLACFHWCAQQAITCGAFNNICRYRHPDVRRSEMLQRQSG